MNTAELTALHNETIAEMGNARTLANITRRASSLFSDGYSAAQEGAGSYTVFTPAGDSYWVNVNDLNPADTVFGNFCTCPAFPKYGSCKHLEAILMQRNEEAQIAAYEAGECGPYGMDAGSRY